MNKTKIEWTDLSVNPIRARRKDGSNRVPGHYCEKISPGCANCYASQTQPRFGMPKFDKADLGPNKFVFVPAAAKSTTHALDYAISGSKHYRHDEVEVYLDGDVLLKVLRRRKPARIFWCDMTDMFGSWVKDEWLNKMFAVMALTPHLTHQLLTKRPERMREYLTPDHDWPRWQQHARANALRLLRDIPAAVQALPNVHLGVSVENQEQADKRIVELQKTPAALRFLSVEPLLGPVDLSGWLTKPQWGKLDPKTNTRPHEVVPRNDLLHWVIVGGESGPGARYCALEWIGSIVQQCKAAGVPCFVKQVGSAARSGAHSYFNHRRINHPKGADPSEWPESLRVREMPEATA